jgi:fructokinase
MNPHGRDRPLVFGEVLFDRFPDGGEVLGGAPFNVAWHLRGFGLDPLFVGRVGVDAAGERVRDRMAHWNLDAAGLQDDLTHGTGLVRAHFEDGDPHYDIVTERAWDFVDTARALAAARTERLSLLYHGTLALRHERTRDALLRLREAFEVPVICDVNLRPPWTPVERVHEVLSGATIAKLNQDELAALTGMEVSTAAGCVEAGRALLSRHALRLVIATRGEEGAVAVRDDAHWSAPAQQPERVVDTVGAGDAFSAVTIIGLLEEWPLPTLLARAAGFAASICSIRGATTEDDTLHRAHRTRWRRGEEDDHGL